MGDKMAGMEQVKSDSQCQDMADTGRCGTNAAWHLMPHNYLLYGEFLYNPPISHDIQNDS
jgi:hypothetical protein